MQSPAGSFETISPTAYMVAYARQFTDIPYSKQLAQLVDAQTFMEQLREKNLEQPAEIAVIVEANYKSVDQAIIQIAQSDACQILELATGLSPRGMAMSENPDVTFVESDLYHVRLNTYTVA
ncbi:hypothetical protein CEN39_23530 [Fischerella thermalis CCMEE 5201]|nr:hypothetical protein CEN39_23530 [Fischerella thermalis CCMEE 5201]